VKAYEAEDTWGRKPAPIFDSRKHTWMTAIKDDDDAVATAIMRLDSCKLKRKEEHVIDMNFHQFCTVYKHAKTKTMNFNQSQLFLSITCFRKSTPKIRPVFGPMCLQPSTCIVLQAAYRSCSGAVHVTDRTGVQPIDRRLSLHSQTALRPTNRTPPRSAV